MPSRPHAAGYYCMQQRRCRGFYVLEHSVKSRLGIEKQRLEWAMWRAWLIHLNCSLRSRPNWIASSSKRLRLSVLETWMGLWRLGVPSWIKLGTCQSWGWGGRDLGWQTLHHWAVLASSVPAHSPFKIPHHLYFLSLLPHSVQTLKASWPTTMDSPTTYHLINIWF